MELKCLGHNFLLLKGLLIAPTDLLSCLSLNLNDFILAILWVRYHPLDYFYLKEGTIEFGGSLQLTVCLGRGICDVHLEIGLPISILINAEHEVVEVTKVMV
jgi:hypothetical protein